MIRKFVQALAFAVATLTITTGAAVQAQQAPETPQPTATQEPQSPDLQTDEIGRQKKTRAHDYHNWTFNVGGGANLASGTTRTFVKGGGVTAAAGVARNVNKYLGLRLDFMWADLPLRTSALQLAQAPTGTDHVYALMLDPIINIPVTKKYSGYLLVGPGFYHRSGKLDSSTAVPGSACNAFWDWWGTCFNASLPLSKDFLSAHQNQFGINVGGGVARKVWGNVEIYGEFRYLHGKHNDITTDIRPFTVGIRW